MLDFHINANVETTLLDLFIVLFVYLLTVLGNRKLVIGSSRLLPSNIVWRNYLGLLLGIVFLQIAAITRGDFYHYGDFVQHFTPSTESHMEPFYVWLIGFTHRNYLLWRVIIWGGALLLTYLTAKRLEINSVYTFFFLCVCFIFTFNYARTSLGIALYFYGLSFLIKPGGRKIISYIFGVILIYLSKNFHSSMYILIILTPFLFIKLKPIWIFAILLVAYWGYSKIQVFAPELFAYFNAGEDVLENRWDLYVVQSEYGSQGLGGRIHEYLLYGSYYLLFAIITYIVLIKQQGKIEKPILLMYRILFAVVFMASIFGIAIDAPIFFYRTLYMATIPLCLISSYLYTNCMLPQKWAKMFLLFCVANVGYEFLYNIYLKI